MKALRLRRLLLWPRFQQYVKQDLEAAPLEVRQLTLLCRPAQPAGALVHPCGSVGKCLLLRFHSKRPPGAAVGISISGTRAPALMHRPPPTPHVQLVEWQVGATPSMLAIQEALVELMAALLKDLSRTNKVDMCVHLCCSLWGGLETGDCADLVRVLGPGVSLGASCGAAAMQGCPGPFHPCKLQPTLTQSYQCTHVGMYCCGIKPPASLPCLLPQLGPVLGWRTPPLI